MLFTIGVYCDYGKKAMDIAQDEDYGDEEGIKVENYKYEDWEQGEFKGCADSWTTKFTDDAVKLYEDEYYEGLTIHDNTSYGKGVMFDYGGNAYIVNYELYSDKEEDKTKANSYLDKIIKSLKVYDGTEERDESTEV